MIIFDEKTHTYTNSITNEIYTSVTTLIGKFKKPFDTDYHANRIAKRDGKTYDEVIKEWNDIKQQACDKGNAIHGEMERLVNFKRIIFHYIKHQTIPKELVDKIPKHINAKLCYSLLAKISDINNIRSIESEYMVYDDESKVAGTGDLFIVTNKGFYVKDFKTNKRFRYTSPFNEFLLPPVDHLSACEFNIYGLQLSLYGLMYERITNTKCLGLEIYYATKDGWKNIPCNYMKYEAEAILNANIQSLS